MFFVLHFFIFAQPITLYLHYSYITYICLTSYIRRKKRSQHPLVELKQGASLTRYFTL
mgnify:CR=1